MQLDGTEYDLRSTVVPFVARALRHGPSRSYAPAHWPIPVGHPEIYFDDDVEGFRGVLSQGVLYALCYAASGWRQLPVLVGKEAWLSEARQARLWEVMGEVSLRYTETSLRLSEGIYNMVARRPREAEKNRRYELHTPKAEVQRLQRLTFEATGDLALAYWLLVAVWTELDPASSGERVKGGGPYYEAALAHFAAIHPLLGLRFGSFLAQPVGPNAVEIEAWLRGPFLPLLPWWLGHALAWWRERQGGLWKAPAPRYVAVRRAQAAHLKAWVSAAQRLGWLHLLVPVAEHLAWEIEALREVAREEGQRGDAASELSATALAWIDRAFRDQRQAERFEVRAAWSGLLDVGRTLDAAYQDVMRIHPVDRDGHQAWLASFWAEEGMGSVVAVLNEVSRGIEGRLG